MSNSTSLSPPPTDAEVIAVVSAAPPPVPDNTYELALVMGGTVSSGAYTAGAVDFLIEALDCFAAEKTKPGSRCHDVVLKVLCGTSGGAVTAAIMARALNYQFPSQFYGAPAAGETVNPLYNVWVKLLDLVPMLDPSDLKTSVPSLLNVKPIENGIDFVINYSNPGTASVKRDWVGAPLTVILTHTNLSGIPYNFDFGSGQSQRYVNHADYAQFAVVYPWQTTLPSAKPYEFSLNFAGKPLTATWADFGEYAVASAAFPLGFVTRMIDRPMAQYYYRVFSTATPPQTEADLRVLQPDWTAILNTNNSPTLGNIRYSSVDGGVVDNEPIQLAHIALSGLLGQNPRDTTAANRAVWLIDPFAGETDMSSFNMANIAASAGATLNATLQQCRYSTADLVLALDPNTYSRFMLSAQRGTLSGGDALATAGLDAFMGFACEAFRAHDYYLGRQNCQVFLRTQFRQSAQNPVFNGWTAAQKKSLVDAAGDLPIIPLFGSANTPETTPKWPVGAFNPNNVKGAIETRLKAVLDKEVFPDNLIGQFLGSLAGIVPADIAANYAVNALQSALKDWGLAPGQ
jgi:hypothetical protein